MPEEEPDEPDELGLTNAYWKQKLNAQYLIEQLIDGKTEYTKAVANASRGKMADALPSLVVRTSSKAEHEMLYQQILHTLATSLREAPADTGAVRLVPLEFQRRV